MKFGIQRKLKIKFSAALNKRIFILVLFALAFSYSGIAQGKYKPKYSTSRREKKQPFPSPTDFRQGGWLGGAGLTAMVGFRSTESSFESGTLDGEFQPIPLPGLMLEFGRFYQFKKPFIFHYVDASIAYKGLLGNEDFTISSAGTELASDNHTFNQHFASINGNLNNIIPLSDYAFIQNTIGINADIRFLDGFENNYPAGIPALNDNAFVAQVHYKLGFGYAIDTDLVIETSLETPIFNFTPSGREFSQLDYYQSSYQPFILRVRLLFFRLGNDKCPPVGNPDLPAGFENGYGD